MSKRIGQFINSNIIFIILLLAVASVVFINTLYNGFVYDDKYVIVNNKWIRDLAYLPEIFSTHVWGFKLGSDSNYYRPFVHLILMAEYHLFGLTAWPYHLTNLLVHSANTVMVYLIALHILGERAYGERDGGTGVVKAEAEHAGRFIAFGAGLLFAVHPVHVEAVAPASIISELSLSFFYLASLYFYMRFAAGGAGRARAALFALSLLFYVFNVFLKETAVTLIAVLFVYDITVGAGLRFNLRSILRSSLRYLPYLLILIFYVLIRMHFLAGFVPFKQSASLTVFQYFLNIPPLFAEYIRLLFYPVGLNVFYSFHPVLSVGEYEFLPLLPLLLFLPLLSFLLIKYKRTALFCIFFALLALSPALYIPGVGVRGNAFAERYLYIPSVGFSILISAFVYRLVIKLKTPGVFRGRVPVFLAVIVFIAAVFSVQTVLRNRVWESNYTLWKDAAKKTTDSKVVYINLGSAAGRAGRSAEAIDAYKRAYAIAPDSPEIFNNLGVEYLESGRLDEAFAAFQKALSLTGNPGTVFFIKKNLGNVYLGKGMFDAALKEYSEALLLAPENRALKQRIEMAKRLKSLSK